MYLFRKRDSLGPIATTGTLVVGDQIFTGLEQPWMDNKPFHSCIPAGVYTLEPFNSDKHPDTWVMVNTDLHVYAEPGDIPPDLVAVARFTCLIHAANLVEDVQGCIALGMESGTMYNEALKRGEPAVFQSKKAMDLLRKLLVVGTTHTLEIRNP